MNNKIFLTCLLVMSQTNNTTARSKVLDTRHTVVVKIEPGETLVQGVTKIWNFFVGPSEKEKERKRIERDRIEREKRQREADRQEKKERIERENRQKEADRQEKIRKNERSARLKNLRQQDVSFFILLYIKQALVGASLVPLFYAVIQNVKCVLGLFRSFSWKGFGKSVAVYCVYRMAYIYAEENKFFSTAEKIGMASFAFLCLHIHALIFHSAYIKGINVLFQNSGWRFFLGIGILNLLLAMFIPLIAQWERFKLGLRRLAVSETSEEVDTIVG